MEEALSNERLANRNIATQSIRVAEEYSDFEESQEKYLKNKKETESFIKEGRKKVHTLQAIGQNAQHRINQIGANMTDKMNTLNANGKIVVETSGHVDVVDSVVKAGFAGTVYARTPVLADELRKDT